MSDVATNILAELTNTKDRAAASQSLLTQFRSDSGGAISESNFQSIFAEMELQQPTSTASAFAVQPTNFGLKRTIFECQLYPSYSNNYATAKYEATEMLKALDSNGDGAVSLAELEAYNTSGTTGSGSSQSTSGTASSGASANSNGSTSTGSSSSASSGSSTSSTGSSTTSASSDAGSNASSASNSNSSSGATSSSSTSGSASQPTTAPTFIAMPLTMMASVAETASATNLANMTLKTFDTTGKGYFNLADLQAAYTANPALGDPNQAQADITQFDENNDGQITQQELVNGFQRMDIASNLQADFDPNNTGSLNLTLLTPQIESVSPSLSGILKAWDADANNQLTATEISAGLKGSSMSLTELSALVESVNASISSEKTMGQYDTANKGYITATDLSTAWASANSNNDPTSAQTAIAAWDENGDGQVNLGEMINGQQVNDLASQLLAQFDPAGNGYIDVGATGASAMAAAPNLFNLLKSWDADNNGQLTSQEIMNGIQTSNLKAQLQAKQQSSSTTATDAAAQATSIMSQVDSNYDGQINLDEFLTFAGSNASIAADPISTFNAWDSNKDGYLTLDEIQTGIQTIQQAQSIISQYDTTSKGYFDINDMQTALSSANPTSSSSDLTAQAQQIMNFWDSNGDGKVTVQEVIQGIQSGGYVGGQQIVKPAATS